MSVFLQIRTGAATRSYHLVATAATTRWTHSTVGAIVDVDDAAVIVYPSLCFIWIKYRPIHSIYTTYPPNPMLLFLTFPFSSRDCFELHGIDIYFHLPFHYSPVNPRLVPNLNSSSMIKTIIIITKRNRQTPPQACAIGRNRRSSRFLLCSTFCNPNGCGVGDPVVQEKGSTRSNSILILWCLPSISPNKPQQQRQQEEEGRSRLNMCASTESRPNVSIPSVRPSRPVNPTAKHRSPIDPPSHASARPGCRSRLGFTPRHVHAQLYTQF